MSKISSEQLIEALDAIRDVCGSQGKIYDAWAKSLYGEDPEVYEILQELAEHLREADKKLTDLSQKRVGKIK